MGTLRGVELDHLVLTGERIELRPWRSGDVERVHEVMQDERMHTYLALPRPYTRDEARRYVEKIAATARREATALECAVVSRDVGRVVGSAALRLGRQAEIGYWIAGDAQGHGFAAEAGRMLTEWGFAIGLHRVGLLCDTRNVASASTALTAGFAFEGIARDGYLSDAPASAPDRRGDLARFARLADDPGDPIAPVLPRLPPTGLSDGVLRLRITEAGDAPAMAALDDPETLRWSFDGHPMPELQRRRAAADAGLHWLVSRTGARLTMLDEQTGELAGGMGVRLTGPPGVCLLGYSVHPAFRGRGYTARALRLFAAWAFDVAGLARLELGARTANLASQRAALGAGFSAEGVFAGRLRDPDGSYHDEARFALLNPRLAR